MMHDDALVYRIATNIVDCAQVSYSGPPLNHINHAGRVRNDTKNPKILDWPGYPS